jgi:hypothetical protein
LIARSVLVFPVAEAERPRVLGTVSGTLNPGAVTDPPLKWQLNQDVSDFLFYYKITGGSEPGNDVNLTLDDLSLQSLMGEGWEYCDCAFTAGSYNVTVGADTTATAPVTFEIGFYVVPQPPVDISGQIPVNSTMRFSDFGALFPAGNYTLVLGVTSGTYEFFVDNDTSPRAVVTKTTEVTVDLEEGLHLFNVTANDTGKDVVWSVQIQGGEPKLEPRILVSCPPINQSNPVCVTGASANASDGSNPSVTYQWTDNTAGGSFNSTNTQWVAWTPPRRPGTFTLTVEASAPGYLSGSDSLGVAVTEAVPEFSLATLVLIFTLTLAVVLFARRSRAKQVGYASEIHRRRPMSNGSDECANRHRQDGQFKFKV